MEGGQKFSFPTLLESYRESFLKAYKHQEKKQCKTCEQKVTDNKLKYHFPVRLFQIYIKLQSLQLQKWLLSLLRQRDHKSLEV